MVIAKPARSVSTRVLEFLKAFSAGSTARSFDIGMLLLIAFGAMLILIVVSGLEAIRITGADTHAGSGEPDQIHGAGTRVLSDIRTNLLWGSIWTGDYLQSRSQAPEEFSRYQLWGLRQEWNMAHARQESLPRAPAQQVVWG